MSDDKVQMAGDADEPADKAKAARAKKKDEKEPERGPHAPAQYDDDDGWGGMPVQMRG